MTDRRLSSGPVAWCLFSALLFGATTPAAKPLVDDMGPLLLSGILYWGAAAAVTPFAVRDWRRHRQRDRRAGGLIGAAFFGGIVGPVFLMWGLALAPAGSVALWLTLETVATAALARLFFREHLGKLGWLATALVVIASAALAGPDRASLQAVLLVGIACLAWGFDNNFTSTIDGYSTTEITWFKGVTAGLVNVPLGLIAGGTILPGPFLSAFTIGAVGYGASLVFYTAGAQQLGATRSQLCFSTAPLFGLAVAWFVFGEHVGIVHAVAVLLMGTAIGLLHFEFHEHRHHHDAVEHIHWHRHDDGHHDHDHESDVGATVWHQHPHRHAPETHRHPHQPDLHHRHPHD